MTYHQFIQRQLEEIDRHKWIESEKAGRDLGDDAVVQWVEKYAEPFHRRLVSEAGELVGCGQASGCPSSGSRRR